MTGACAAKVNCVKMIYRSEIDGLRAIAVISVLVNHFFPLYFPNGYLGVDVFFVISGFVITGSIQSRLNSSIGLFLLDFYGRRIKRLAPALIICIIFTSFLISMIHPFPQEYLRTGIFALFGFSNIYLYSRSTDYFSDAASLNPFTHTWSLGVEEQFYLIFPFLFWIGHNYFKSFLQVPILILVIMISFTFWLYFSESQSLMTFYLTPFRIWQLLLGCLVFFIQKNIIIKTQIFKYIFSIFLCLLIFYPYNFNSNLATIFSTVSISAILFFIHPDINRAYFLDNEISKYLGVISYSLYIWHWPLIVLSKITIGQSIVTGFICFLLSIGLAHVSHRLLERPLRKANWGSKSWIELSVGLSLIVVVAIALYANSTVLRHYLFLGEKAQLQAAGVKSLVQPFTSASSSRWAGEACVFSDNNQVGKNIDATLCIVGQNYSEAELRVLIFGNSFSAALVQAFDELALYGGRSTAFVVTSSWGASPVPELGFQGNWKDVNAYYWQQIVPSLIEEIGEIDEVLIVSDLASFSPIAPTDESRNRTYLLEKGLRRFSSELAEMGIGLSILGPLPFARDAKCAPDMAVTQWYHWGGGICQFYSRDETIQRLSQISDLFKNLQNDGVIEVLDLFPVFCPGSYCTYESASGEMLYRDIYSHSSIEASHLSRPIVASWTNSIFNRQRPVRLED